MDKLTVVFTKDTRNPLSWLIRWVLPRSRFAWALSSHCYIVNGDDWYQSVAPKGVCKVSRSEALRTDTIVKTIDYYVPNASAGIAFLESQLGKKYDYKGAIGLGIGPDRNWSDSDRWFCYELAAMALKVSGGPQFNSVSHITEIALMAIAP